MESRERRKRSKIPTRLLIFGVLFLLLPIINYLSTVYWYDIPINGVWAVFKQYDIWGLGLLLSAFIVGIGLLSVKKWGWYTFLIYGLLLIAYNLGLVIINKNLYNLGALGQTLFGFAAITYFLQKDISAPYMKMYPRGWRLEKRLPLEIDVAVNDNLFRTRDAGPAGIFVHWPKCNHAPGDEVLVTFALNEEQFDLRAGITRVEENGVGLAFRRLDQKTKMLLRKSLKTTTSKIEGKVKI